MYVAVVPFVDAAYFRACAATCKFDILPIDNTQRNVGCTVAWNIGLKHAFDSGLDWCVWMSSACRFGAPGGVDFIEALRANPDAHVVASPVRGHLIAVHRSVTARVGYCDENFWPSYWQDADWAYRVRLAFGADLRWQCVDVDVRSAEISHALTRGLIQVDAPALAAYFQRKWGGTMTGTWEDPQGNIYTTPFGDPTKSLAWWPPPGHPLALPRPTAGQFIATEA